MVVFAAAAAAECFAFAYSVGAERGDGVVGVFVWVRHGGGLRCGGADPGYPRSVDVVVELRGVGDAVDGGRVFPGGGPDERRQGPEAHAVDRRGALRDGRLGCGLGRGLLELAFGSGVSGNRRRLRIDDRADLHRGSRAAGQSREDGHLVRHDDCRGPTRRRRRQRRRAIRRPRQLARLHRSRGLAGSCAVRHAHPSAGIAKVARLQGPHGRREECFEGTPGRRRFFFRRRSRLGRRAKGRTGNRRPRKDTQGKRGTKYSECCRASKCSRRPGGHPLRAEGPLGVDDPHPASEAGAERRRRDHDLPGVHGDQRRHVLRLDHRPGHRAVEAHCCLDGGGLRLEPAAGRRLFDRPNGRLRTEAHRDAVHRGDHRRSGVDGPLRRRRPQGRRPPRDDDLSLRLRGGPLGRRLDSEFRGPSPRHAKPRPVHRRRLQLGRQRHRLRLLRLRSGKLRRRRRLFALPRRDDHRLRLDVLLPPGNQGRLPRGPRAPLRTTTLRLRRLKVGATTTHQGSQPKAPLFFRCERRRRPRRRPPASRRRRRRTAPPRRRGDHCSRRGKKEKRKPRRRNSRPQGNRTCLKLSYQPIHPCPDRYFAACLRPRMNLALLLRPSSRGPPISWTPPDAALRIFLHVARGGTQSNHIHPASRLVTCASLRTT
mmetsp:Transcript_37777/g.121217  ORF Transcript_37777/g.121217 Transcript_37777/m.121217 type:complete len:653 (-) Transcript_37777:61-2019(-)